MLAIHGSHDDLAPRLHAETLRSAVPGVRLTWVDTATHDPHRVEPQRCAGDMQVLWTDAEMRAGRSHG